MLKELGCWGQTVQRWLEEGAPADKIYWNFWQGEPFFTIDRHDYAHLHAGMIPDFGYTVLEEDERYVTARHGNGIVTKALKDGTVGGTRMSMDQYLRHPAAERLLRNMLNYAARAVNKRPADLPPDFDKQLETMGYKYGIKRAWCNWPRTKGRMWPRFKD